MEHYGGGCLNILFEGLTKAETEELKRFLPVAEAFKKGAELYKNKVIGIIVKGRATVRRISLTGQPLIIRSLEAGDIFGAASLFGDWKEGASSIKADSTGQIIYINENDFKNLILRFPKVNFNYIHFLTERIRFLNRRIDAFSADSTEQKLYEFLLSQKDGDGVYTLTVTMSKLSYMLNVGRTSLYRDMASLEEKGLIKRENKKIYIY